MAVKVEISVAESTDSELIWEHAYRAAGAFLDRVEQSGKFFDHPAARSLTRQFLALQLLEPFAESIGIWGPLTSFHLTELSWNRTIEDEIRRAKELGKRQLSDLFGQICDNSGLDPQSEQARELYQSSQETARVFVDQAFRTTHSAN